MEGNYIFHQDSKTYSPDQQPYHGETTVYSTQRIDLFNNILFCFVLLLFKGTLKHKD